MGARAGRDTCPFPHPQPTPTMDHDKLRAVPLLTKEGLGVFPQGVGCPLQAPENRGVEIS